MANPKHAWMVRAGNDNSLADSVESKKAIAIGWDEIGDLSAFKTREQFKERYRTIYPDDSPGQIPVNAGQLYRFASEIKPEDYLLTYIKASREILIGLVGSPYKYDPSLFDKEYPHVRAIQWIKRVSRDSFSQSARNTLGSVLTVFQVDNIIEEIHHLAGLAETTAKNVEVIETSPLFYADTKAKADELIADLVSKLPPYDFQDLVAAVLRAMGFQARSSPPGRDRGVDIVAHPDAFGFAQPHIKVQVKHRKDAATGPEMRSFIGALTGSDKGLFVSTGGFTSDAERAADGAREPVKMLDRDAFIQLLLENYEAIAPQFKAKIPLNKVWIPAE